MESDIVRTRDFAAFRSHFLLGSGIVNPILSQSVLFFCNNCSPHFRIQFVIQSGMRIAPFQTSLRRPRPRPIPCKVQTLLAGGKYLSRAHNATVANEKNPETAGNTYLKDWIIHRQVQWTMVSYSSKLLLAEYMPWKQLVKWATYAFTSVVLLTTTDDSLTFNTASPTVKMCNAVQGGFFSICPDGRGSRTTAFPCPFVAHESTPGTRKRTLLAISRGTRLPTSSFVPLLRQCPTSRSGPKRSKFRVIYLA